MASSTIWAPIGEQGPPGPPGPPGPEGPPGPAGPGLDAYIALIASSAGSNNVGFIQDGAGAVLRTAQAKMRDIVSVKDFGAVGDGVTDDTAAMTAAHATGKVVFYPQGEYSFDKITFVSGGIVGEGRSGTILRSTNADASNVISITGTANAPIFMDFSLICLSISSLPAKTGGAGIHLSPTVGENGYSRFENVLVAFAPICIRMVSAPYFKMEGIEVLGYNFAGVTVENLVNPDSGDGVISGSLFNGTSTVGSAIIQYSSGGLKIIGNKMLGGSEGYSLQYRGTNNSGVLVINGNSIENMAASCISLARIDGSFNFANVVITGNEFAVSANGLFTDANVFLSEVVIANNVFNIFGGVDSTYCMNVSAFANFYIGGNTFRGNGGSTAGLVINASCANGKVGQNVFSNLTTPIVNNSTTTSLQRDSQAANATTSASGWNPFGSLFSSAPISVTFPRAFSSVAPSAPQITFTPTSTTGICSGIVTGVTNTGFTFFALSSVTGIAATIGWRAEGIF